MSADTPPECICNVDPETTDGPDEDCPRHGYPSIRSATADADLEARVRQHAASCDVSRFAAAYEFASMLDGYDPAKWRDLATSRGLHPFTGKPPAGSGDR